MSVDLLIRLVFEFAFAQIWDSPAVIQRLAFTLRTMTDRTILTKQRCLVSLTLRDDVTFSRAAAAGEDRARDPES